MPEYRVYSIGSDGHFFATGRLECDDDIEAVELTKQLIYSHDVELWQRDRKIARFKKALLIEQSGPSPLNHKGNVAMATMNDRIELERRLEQARQMAKQSHDPLTKERLAQLVRVLEGELR